MHIKSVCIILFLCWNSSLQKHLISCNSSFPDKGGCFDNFNEAINKCPTPPKTYKVLYNYYVVHNCYCCE